MDNTLNNQTSKQLLSTKSLVLSGLFAAILCISAYWSIPTPLPMAPKFTLMNFMILLIALLFPVTESFLIGLVWFLLGVAGLPVFIGGGSGIGYLIAPYGAYTWAFPIVLIILPLIRGKKYNRIWYIICGIIGVLIIHIIGILWLQHSLNHDLKTAFLTGFIPFFPLDLIKAIVVAQIVPAFKRIMEV